LVEHCKASGFNRRMRIDYWSKRGEVARHAASCVTRTTVNRGMSKRPPEDQPDA
jgi:hypothetical protein